MEQEHSQAQAHERNTQAPQEYERSENAAKAGSSFQRATIPQQDEVEALRARDAKRTANELTEARGDLERDANAQEKGEAEEAAYLNKHAMVNFIYYGLPGS